MIISTRKKLFIYLAVSYLSANYVFACDSHCEYQVDSPYILIKSDLYQNTEGDVYFGSHRASLSNERDGMVPVFINRFGYPDDDYLYPQLKEIIDTGTWERMSYRFYRDNNNLYCFSYNTGGGHLSQKKKSDPNNVMFWDGGRWKTPGIIKEEYIVLEEKYKIDIDIEANEISSYVTDGLEVFYKCGSIKNADFETFQVDNYYKWWAIDKNKIYEGRDVISIIELNHLIEGVGSKQDRPSVILLKELNILKKKYLAYQKGH